MPGENGAEWHAFHDRVVTKTAHAIHPHRPLHRGHLKEIFEDLGTTTFMKECLRSIYHLAPTADMAKIAFEYWCKLADETKIACLKTMAKTIRNHLDGILAYWTESQLTSAGMEGFNNKVRWLIRQAYGYRDSEYFRLKIFDLPEVKICKEL